MPTPVLRAPDKPCADAVDLAREALRAVAGNPGDHLSVTSVGERLVTHYFASNEPGYVGWRWAVTVARAPRAKNVTVCETWLEASDEAVLAPPWVPWSERLAPGDVGVGDLLPTAPDDPRLAPGYVASDDPAIEELSHELGLGRVRVLSREGRSEAAQRWYDTDHGPRAPIAEAAPDVCARCGFFLPLAGSLSAAFGACGNEYAPDDGRVVAVDHGCGAHSESRTTTSAEDSSDWPAPVATDGSFLDADFDLVERSPAGDQPAHTPGSVEDEATGEPSPDDELGHG